MFKPTGWALHPLLAREHLGAFDIPLDMDKALLDASCKQRIRSVIQRSMTPLVVTAVFRAMWTDTGGGVRDNGFEQPRLTGHGTDTGGKVEGSGNVDSGEDIDNWEEDERIFLDREDASNSVIMNTSLSEEGNKEKMARAAG
jgi:hypothetical protein